MLIRLPSAYTAFSEEEDCLIFCNLYDGFTVYRLTPYLPKIDVITVENEDNIPLSARFIHNDKYILLGSAVGRVKIVGLPDSHNQRISITLPHGGMFMNLKAERESCLTNN